MKELDCDLVAHVDDEHGDSEAGHRIGPPVAGGYAQQAEEGADGRDGVEPRVASVGD
jgi:hypothetical protein